MSLVLSVLLVIYQWPNRFDIKPTNWGSDTFHPYSLYLFVNTFRHQALVEREEILRNKQLGETSPEERVQPPKEAPVEDSRCCFWRISLVFTP